MIMGGRVYIKSKQPKTNHEVHNSNLRSTPNSSIFDVEFVLNENSPKHIQNEGEEMTYPWIST